MIGLNKTEDKPKLVEILQKNMLKYFDALEQQDLGHYLQHHRQHYFVCAWGSEEIVASGALFCSLTFLPGLWYKKVKTMNFMTTQRI